MKTKIALYAGLAAALTAPFITFAQSANVQSLFAFALTIINNYLVPIVFALAFLMFLFGIYRYFIQARLSGSGEGAKDGPKFLLWSIIAFVVMFSIWGIINILLNTFPGFAGSSEPAIPTFNYTPSSLTSLFPGSSIGNGIGSFLGGITGSTGTTGTTATTYGTDPTTGLPITATNQVASNGCLVYSNGQTGTPNGAGGCVAPNGQTVPAGAAGAAGPQGGTMTTGQGCLNNTQCAGQNNVCNTATGTCSPDGPTVYSCDDDSTPTAGKCADGTAPANVNGDPAPAGSNGAACTNNTQCSDICNTVTGTCATAGSNTYFCADDSTPTNGQCANGQPPENTGDQTAAPNGSVALGGSCINNSNACSGDNTTCGDDGKCETDTGNGDSSSTGGGSGSSSGGSTGVCNPGDTPATNPACGSGQTQTTCTNSDIPPAGGSCTMCSDGLTSADPTCADDGGLPGSTSSVGGQGGNGCCNGGSNPDPSTGLCSDGQTDGC